MIKIAVIGRPNVGKSTLFNRLCGGKRALVHDMPGMTRDRKESEADIFGVTCTLIDTAGLEEGKPGSLQERMMDQTRAALDEADFAIMVADAKSGVTPADRYFTDMLRVTGKDAVLAVNKSDADRNDQGYYDALSLGIPMVVSVSAEHGLGMYELEQACGGFIKKTQARIAAEAETSSEDSTRDADSDEDNGLLRIAIIGRPNAGKSTLTNAIIGKERVLTGPEAGITRDTISIPCTIEGRDILLADTAGLRKKSNIIEAPESLSVGDALRAVRFAHIVVLLTDINAPLEKQDLTLAALTEREGRCLVVALNKTDICDDIKDAIDESRYILETKTPSVTDVPFVSLSALKGKNIKALFETCFKTYENWNKRVSTNRLNRWLKDAESANPPPLGKNKRPIRLKYITQGNIRPPTFTLFVNYPTDLPSGYKRYLSRKLAKDFGMEGVPIRLMLRKSNNPYISSDDQANAPKPNAPKRSHKR